MVLEIYQQKHDSQFEKSNKNLYKNPKYQMCNPRIGPRNNSLTHLLTKSWSREFLTIFHKPLIFTTEE